MIAISMEMVLCLVCMPGAGRRVLAAEHRMRAIINDKSRRLDVESNVKWKFNCWNGEKFSFLNVSHLNSYFISV